MATGQAALRAPQARRPSPATGSTMQDAPERNHTERASYRRMDAIYICKGQSGKDRKQSVVVRGEETGPDGQEGS